MVKLQLDEEVEKVNRSGVDKQPTSETAVGKTTFLPRFATGQNSNIHSRL